MRRRGFPSTYPDGLPPPPTSRAYWAVERLVSGVGGDPIGDATGDMGVTDTTPAMLSEALRYVRLGWFVFPVHTPVNGGCSCRRADCDNQGKHPRTKHGLDDATRDEEQIRAWWRMWPEANIAVATGPSGLVAIDIDPKNGGAYETLAERFGAPALDTVTAQTGSGGSHLVYRKPPGIHVSNVNNSPRFTGPLGAGIDVRADGGYIVVAPSRHLSGYAYEWEADYSPWDRVPERLPDAILDVLTARPERKADDRDLLDVASILQGVPAGERDWQLFLLAAKLRGADVPREWAYQLVGDAAARCQPPFPAEDARKKVDSAYERYEAGRTAHVEKPEWSTEEVDPETGEVVEQRLLMWSGELDNLPDVEWLIQGVMPKQGLGEIFGKHGSAKTFVMLDMACCVSTGTPWKGFEVERGYVVYVYAEGIRGLRRRVRAWETFHAVTVPHIAFVPRAVRFLQDEDVDFLVTRIRAEMPEAPVLVVVDTLARAMVGGDENKQQDMTVLVDAAARLQRELGCSVWFVHHENLAGGNRGSTVLPGAVDTQLRLVRGEKKGIDDDRVTLSFEKQKDGEEYPDLKLRLTEFEESLVVEMFDAGEHGVITKPNEIAALHALREAHPGTLRNADLQDKLGVGHSQVFNLMKDLKARGWVYSTGAGRSFSYGVTEEGNRPLDDSIRPVDDSESSTLIVHSGGVIDPQWTIRDSVDETPSSLAHIKNPWWLKEDYE